MTPEPQIYRLLITTIDQSVTPSQMIYFGELVTIDRTDPDGYLMIRSLDGLRTVPCIPEELEPLPVWPDVQEDVG